MLASPHKRIKRWQGWTVNKTMGRLTTTYGLLLQASLDLGGNSIENVKAIMSASGNWRVDENGKLAVKEVETEKLKTEKGITTRDQSTGDYYCVYVDSGITRTAQGECGSDVANASDNAATTSNP